MSSESLAAIYDRSAMFAASPLIALAVGVLVLLLVGVATTARGPRTLAVLVTLAVAFGLQLQVLSAPTGVVFDGTFRADRTSALWGLVFLLSTGLAWLFSLGYYREDRPFKVEHDAMMLCTPIGMMLMAGANDLLVFFVGLELLSVPLYALAAFRRDRSASIEAGLKYFLVGAFAAAFFLYGASLIYTATGTLSLDTLRAIGLRTPLALAGVAMIAASLLFKVSVFPFHLWVPDVYQGAPTPVTALMATGTKAAAFAFLLNATFLLPTSAAMTIAVIAIVTMALGNLGALVQTDLKRMLAYSGIAHAGTVLLVVAGSLAGDPVRHGAQNAALFYMAAYVFTAAGAFGLLSLLEREDGPVTSFDSIRGLAQRRPWIAASMTLFMLSLGGIPLTGGFLGKYLVFYVAVRADMTVVAVLGVLLSVVALGYYLRVIVAMYMQAPSETTPSAAPRSSPVPATLAASACALFVLAMGVLPAWFLDQLR